ncbi:MAG: hypothetical protein IPO91_23340 [Chloroflexi bacterium]|nr:hypothetical protein [Chloroflexota bacterium]
MELLARLLQHKNILRSYADCPNPVLSLGGSAVLGAITNDEFPVGVDEIRIGEAIALGTDGLGNRIADTFDDAFILMAEVVDRSRRRPKSSFDFRDSSVRALIGIGYQDVDVNELIPLDSDVHIVGSTSDHTILEAKSVATLGKVGKIIRFVPSYRALVQLNTSSYVNKRLVR